MKTNTTPNDDFYQNLRSRIKEYLDSDAGKKFKFAKFLLLAPDLLHLLCKLSLDRDVPVKEKAILAGAIAYFVSPIDLIPEALTGPVGIVDDVAVAAFALNSIINRVDQEIVNRHWAGDDNLLDVIQSILQTADEMVGSGLWSKIKGMFDKN